jgi:hypothetical protein
MIEDLVPSAEQLAAVFAHAAAPAFLLAGVGGFVSVLMGRINTVVDRLRSLSEVIDGDPARGHLKGDIPLLKRRAVLLHRSAYLALLAGISTTALLVLSVATALLKIQHLYGGALLFGVATALLTASLFNFAQELKIALSELQRY